VVVPKIYYGWIMLFAIALMSFASSGSRFSFGVFVIPMTQELNWGRDQLALAASLNLILAGLLRPLVGILADRLGSKVIALTGVAVGGSALILTSFARELWQFYLAYGILLAIGYSFTSPVTVTTLVSQWFVKRRSLAMSIGSTGTSLGELITVPLAMFAVITVGWENAFRVIAAFMIFIVLPVGFVLLYNRPADKGLEPFGYVPGDGPGGKRGNALSLTLREAARTGDFWRLGLGFFVCGFTMSFASTHFVPFAMDMGFEQMAAANALGLVGAFALMGGLSAGFLGDRFPRKNVLATVYLLRGLSFAVLLQAHDLPTLYLGSFVLGISWTSTGALTSAIAADKFGIKHIGTIFGTMYVIMPIGTGIGAYLSGLIYESRHGYELSLILSALAGLIAAVVVFGVREPDRMGGARNERLPQRNLVPSLAVSERTA
jgi:MFS family permease